MPKSILFFGELPPKTIHGVSISNKINIDVLKTVHSLVLIEEYSALKYHNKPSLSKTISFFKALLSFFVEIFKRRFDVFYGVVYLSLFGILKNFLLLILFKSVNPNSKVILHFHRSDFNIFYKSFINKLLFKAINRLTTKFIVISQKQFDDLPINFCKKEVLLNSVDEHSLQSFKIKQSSKMLNLVFLGNYSHEKGFFDVIDGIKLFNKNNSIKVSLNCYGDFLYQKDSMEIQNITDENIQINNVIYGIEKYQMLQNADLLIAPSYNEGMPLVILESMYLGLPILTSKVGYIAEALGEDYPLFCQAGDLNSIINGIKNFMEIDRLALSNRLTASYEKFSAVIHDKRLLEIFEQ